MKKIASLFLAIAATSCGAPERQLEKSLYNEYVEYKALVNSNDREGANRKLSKAYLKNKAKAERNIPPESNMDTPFWKHLAYEIRTVHSHFEKTENKSGCLTINGLDKDERPSSLSLYYIKEKADWVINGAMVGGHDSTRDYYNAPTCPSRAELLAK